MEDVIAHWLLVGTLLLSGGVVTWVGRKQAAGTLERNSLVGLRTRATMRSDEAWDRAHTGTAGLVTAAGLLPLFGGSALLLLRPAGPTAATIVLTSVGAMLALVLVACVRGSRLAAEVTPRTEGPARRGRRR